MTIWKARETHALFFVEPPPSPYDVRFDVAGVPVRIHPFFWLTTLLLGMGGRGEPIEVLLWGVAVLVCLLVHELGHVVAFRYYGIDAHVVLHAFGGLAIPSGGRWGSTRRRETWLADVAISLAGPFAGFLFGAAIFLGLALGGREPQLVLDPYRLIYMRWIPFDAENVNILLWHIQYINIFWGLVNLLPVVPLDGGQVARAILVKLNPADGMRQSLALAVLVAGGLAGISLVRWHATFGAIFFGYMAYQNFVLLQHISGGGFGGRGW